MTDDSPFSMHSKGLVKSSATPGETSVSAYKGNGDGEVEFEASTGVMALAPGTYKLKGVVWEDNSPTWPVGGARVEVRLSNGSTLTTDTDGSGQYQLFGVFGEVRLRASRDGYERVTKDFAVSRHLGYDVWLPLLKPRAEIAGPYTMTLTAASHCSVGLGEGRLPEGVPRIRSYRVDVKQTGPNLEIMASGPTLRQSFSSRPFIGGVEPQGLWFYFDGSPPYLVEDLSTAQLLVVTGWTGGIDPGRLTGTFTGSFSVFEHEPSEDPPLSTASPIAACRSERHRFQLSR